MESNPSPNPIDILLVEDNAGDVFLFKSSLGQSQVPHILHQVDDGEAAMAFLYQQAEYSDAPRPHLVVLDLNLPRKDGREVLAELKADPVLKKIPVIVMTGSTAKQDILKSYELSANCYITKPTALRDFKGVVQSLEEFWLHHVQLPTLGAGS